MKSKLTLILLLLTLSSIAFADNKTKLKPIWLTKYTDALKYAKKFDRPILVNFTGSDWCGWCVKLKKEVFDKKEFKEFASTDVILFEADFPNRKKQSAAIKGQNKKLKEKFGITGYPSIILLNSKGEKITKTGYKEGGPVKYVEMLREMLEGKS
jgi:thioredoxin-related protein